jgi:hypothetical protein
MIYGAHCAFTQYFAPLLKANHLIQSYNFQKRQGNSSCRLTTQAKKSRTYRVLFPLIDYTEVIGMYNEKSKAEKYESHLRRITTSSVQYMENWSMCAKQD